ncbi:MAG: hypothetical protein IKV09_00680 [Alistipes sp.]|nr:hypothetical protein [Alistipes sp.]
MKRFIVTLLTLLVALPTMAQSMSQARRDALLEYQARRRQALQEYQDNYRKAAAEYMRQRWEAFNVEAPISEPQRKEPVEPVVKQPTSVTPPAEQRMPAGEVVDLPKPTTPTETVTTTPTTPQVESKPEPKVEPKREVEVPRASDAPKATTPVTPTKTITPQEPKPEKITAPEKPVTVKTPQPTKPVEKVATPTVISPKAQEPKLNTSRALKFSFYGTTLSVSLSAAHTVALSSVQESAVATEWGRIASGKYDNLFSECREIKEQLQLNDWGYYMLVRTICNTFCGKATNESVLLQSFLMSEAGYKMRLARGDNRLRLLLSVDTKIYSKPYFTIAGETFYLLDGEAKASRFNICNFPIPGERPLAMVMHNMPLLNYRAGTAITRTDIKLKTSVTVTPNLNLTAFMSDYPSCSWEAYASAHLSKQTASVLLPTLRKAIEGKDEVKAVETLLSFLHYGFPYKTDPQQFGVERTFFAEEMFAYTYSDCEDRSILLAQLVKELLGLDVMLLNYPEHIATAVKFKGAVAGDYVQLGSSRYVVCDATYIGAKVGEAMPEFKKVSAKMIRIN